MIVRIYNIKSIENKFFADMIQNVGKDRYERNTRALPIGSDNISKCRDISVEFYWQDNKIYLFYKRIPIGEVICWY